MQDKQEKILCDICNGEKYIIKFDIVIQCCGFYDKNYECCNNPIPVQELCQVQCEKCSGTGYINKKSSL